MKRPFTTVFCLFVLAALASGTLMAQKERRIISNTLDREVKGAVLKAGSPTDRMEIPTVRQSGSLGFSVPRRDVGLPFRYAVRRDVPGNLPTLYGSMVYSDDVFLPSGLYNLPKSSQESFDMIIKGVRANYGGVCKDGVYYATNLVQGSMESQLTITGYNVATGEIVYNYQIGEQVGPLIAMGVDLDPVTDEIYGIVYREDFDGYMLAKIIYNHTPESSRIADIEGRWNTFMIDADGTFYGIRKEYTVIEGASYLSGSTLCKIDRQTGAVTEIGPTGKYPAYVSGGCIDRSTGRMFWSVSDNDSGYLCEINKTTGEATTIYTYPNGEEVCGMYVPVALAADKAPAAVTGVKANFPNGSLEGTVTCTAPMTLFDGSQASGKVTVHLMVNGVEKSSVETSYGSLVSFPLTLAEPDFYNFIVYAENQAGKGPKVKIDDSYIGKDTPLAPASVVLKEKNNRMTLSWDAVTGSVNDGYIDPAQVVYNVVRYPDKTQVATGISATTFEETLETPESQTAYTYGVTAVYNDLKSKETVSNAVSLGVIVPPYSSNFSDPTGFSGFTIINANNDDYTWELNTDYGFARIRWNSTKAMDDYLITPPIKLNAGESYEVSFEAYSSSVANVERLEVKWGDEPTVEGLKYQAVGPTDINNGGLSAPGMLISAYITPPADGLYYIGVHGISPKDKSALWVGDIKIAAPKSADLPGMVTDLKAVPDPDGSLSATISFTAPTVTMGETPLQSLTKIEVKDEEGNVVHNFASPEPGQSLSCVVTEQKAGNYTYNVVCYNNSGAGINATVTTHIGLDIPAMPENFTIVAPDYSGKVNLTWSAVNTDQNGNAINPELVSYTLCRIVGGEQVEIASDIKATSYSFQAVDEGKQEFVQCVVFASTDGGYGKGVLSEMIPVGTPYPGLAESFAKGVLHYIWGTGGDGSAAWGLYNDRNTMSSQDNDNGFVGMEAYNVGDSAYIFSGLVSLENMENPGLTFYTFNMMGEAGTPDENILRVYISENGSAYKKVLENTIQELCNSQSGWGKVKVDLSEYKDKVVQVKFEGEGINFAYLLLDNIRIADILNHDLQALDINAPASVNAGESFRVNVTYQNTGLSAASDYKVELYADGKMVDSKEGVTIQPDAKMVQTFYCDMPAIASEPVAYHAVINYSLDANTDNNVTPTVTVTPHVPKLPVINDLKATIIPDAVELAWSAPDFNALKGQPVTDDFEDAEAFASSYGDWKFVDVDNVEVGGFEQTDIPGIDPGYTKGSFWVWDHALLGNQYFEAHSGTKYLFSLYRADQGKADDWAISPELDGMKQTVSFYAKSYDDTYPEEIEIYYSTGSTNYKDFVKVSGAGGRVPGEWTEFKATLPEGAKRFAIRSVAEDAFMLMIDDVTYVPAVTASYQLTGYNVYRDGKQLNGSLVKEPGYIDTDVAESTTYSYAVTAVYTDGESGSSNVVTIFFTMVGIDSAKVIAEIRPATGRLEIVNPMAEEIIVTSIDGIVVCDVKGEEYLDLTVSPGVYVVRVGGLNKTVIIK